MTMDHLKLKKRWGTILTLIYGRLILIKINLYWCIFSTMHRTTCRCHGQLSYLPHVPPEGSTEVLQSESVVSRESALGDICVMTCTRAPSAGHSGGGSKQTRVVIMLITRRADAASPANSPYIVGSLPIRRVTPRLILKISRYQRSRVGTTSKDELNQSCQNLTRPTV